MNSLNSKLSEVSMREKAARTLGERGASEQICHLAAATHITSCALTESSSLKITWLLEIAPQFIDTSVLELQF